MAGSPLWFDFILYKKEVMENGGFELGDFQPGDINRPQVSRIFVWWDGVWSLPKFGPCLLTCNGNLLGRLAPLVPRGSLPRREWDCMACADVQELDLVNEVGALSMHAFDRWAHVQQIWCCTC
jgi:hypothetical protein